MGQEQYLCSVKNILDFLDHHILFIQHKFPDDIDINDLDSSQSNELLNLYHDFFAKLKQQTVVQHKKWLLTFFCQYKLLDNRFGITKMEYLDFIHKLPNKTRTFFQSLTGIHTRFKQLNVSDELNKPHSTSPSSVSNKYARRASIGMDILNEYKSTKDIEEELGANTVLLYKDMSELIYKVHDDVGSANKQIEQELAEKMLTKEKYHKQRHHVDDQKEYEEDEQMLASPNNEYILSHKMSVSLARDAPQISIGKGGHSHAKSPNAASFVGSNSLKYHRMSVENDSDDEQSRTFKSSHRNLSISTLASKMKSFDNGMYTEQATLGPDDVWHQKVMTDLKDGDDAYYDYSDSHKL